MTLAQDMRIQNNQKVTSHFWWQGSQLGRFVLKRPWWHINAYTTVLGMMLLTFASLGFLYIHSSGRKLTQIFQNNPVLEQE
ncbi:MAG TPA: hypothetical protein VE956_15115 [Nodularia sp. (in: cyanobacteria)]|nr:hypothetical protein [Nodularia sp. (in: cyanobacteria)]